MVRYDVPPTGEAAASDDGGSGGSGPKTQVFRLQYLDPNANSALITSSIAQLYSGTDDPVAVPFIDVPTRTVVVTTSMKYLRKIEKLLARIDVRLPQVNIEGKIVEMNQGMSRQLGIDWSAVQQQGSPNTNVQFDTGLASSFVSQLRYTTVQNGFNINSRIQAAVSENKADLVSAPNITANDNQAAIINTSDTQVSVNTTTTFNNGVTSVTQQFNQVQIPLQLSVKPKISLLERRVLMDVVFTLTTVSGAPPVAGAPSPTSNQNATTSVNVNSGDTEVIGGLVRQNNIEVENKVPILGDIPLLGLLFKFNTVDKTKKEVIIFITPTIVED
jgi:general secretion pathway protein D